MFAATISKQSHQNAFTKTMTELLIPHWAGLLVMFWAWILQENNTAFLFFLKQVNYLKHFHFFFFPPTMTLPTKCSEITGKKVVSQDEIFFLKSGMNKENISNWYAIHLPWKLSLDNLDNVDVITLANIY